MELPFYFPDPLLVLDKNLNNTEMHKKLPKIPMAFQRVLWGISSMGKDIELKWIYNAKMLRQLYVFPTESKHGKGDKKIMKVKAKWKEIAVRDFYQYFKNYF